MMKSNGLRWLPAVLLVLILYPASARQANAQLDTSYNIGDVVEFKSASDATGWTKGKIATRCIGDICGVLKWNEYTNDWMDGWISTSVSNIRRPGTNRSGLLQSSPQAAPDVPAATTYKVGDRIDLLAGSVEIGGKYVGGTWQPGTIVRVTQTASGMMYYVQHNENHDDWMASAQVRAPTNLISPTARAGAELAALGALKVPKAGSLEESLQNVIRERYEQQGSKDFPVTVAFQGFAVGHTHRYGGPDVHGESADGPGGTASTTVYPVSAQYTVRTAYRDAFLTYQWDNVYECFQNSFSQWQCNLDSGGGGMGRSFREERASFGH